AIHAVLSSKLDGLRTVGFEMVVHHPVVRFRERRIKRVAYAGLDRQPASNAKFVLNEPRQLASFQMEVRELDVPSYFGGKSQKHRCDGIPGLRDSLLAGVIGREQEIAAARPFGRVPCGLAVEDR